jgi:hypothetical protein
MTSLKPMLVGVAPVWTAKDEAPRSELKLKTAYS